MSSTAGTDPLQQTLFVQWWTENAPETNERPHFSQYQRKLKDVSSHAASCSTQVPQLKLFSYYHLTILGMWRMWRSGFVRSTLLVPEICLMRSWTWWPHTAAADVSASQLHHLWKVEAPLDWDLEMSLSELIIMMVKENQSEMIWALDLEQEVRSEDVKGSI